MKDELSDQGDSADRWIRKKAGFSVKLVFPKIVVREVTTVAAKLDIISEGEALIILGNNLKVPEFFYLEFNSEQDKFYGCHQTGRIGNAIYCRFLEQLKRSEVDHLIAENRVMNVLDAIWESKT